MAARSTWHLRAARRDPPRARAGTRGGARNLRLPAEPPETAEHRTYARDPVPHIREWCEHLPQIPHPSVASAAHIVHDADYVIEKSIVNLGGGGGESDAGIRANDDNCADPGVDGNNTSSVTCYPRAGPRATIAFDSMRGEVCAAVVSCGGLCPGMNTVVREIVTCLWMRYGVREIWGIRNGFRGFYSSNYVPMTAESVQNLHRKGGTVLGTSRGGFDVGMVVDAIQHRRINMVFVIGGDGTHKGAQAMVDEVKRRRLKVAIACVPKTVRMGCAHDETPARAADRFHSLTTDTAAHPPAPSANQKQTNDDHHHDHPLPFTIRLTTTLRRSTSPSASTRRWRKRSARSVQRTSRRRPRQPVWAW